MIGLVKHGTTVVLLGSLSAFQRLTLIAGMIISTRLPAKFVLAPLLFRFMRSLTVFLFRVKLRSFADLTLLLFGLVLLVLFRGLKVMLVISVSKLAIIPARLKPLVISLQAQLIPVSVILWRGPMGIIALALILLPLLVNLSFGLTLSTHLTLLTPQTLVAAMVVALAAEARMGPMVLH
ncbi:hypothetical protein LO50_17070 [Stutzerimonas stutzeri]|uniref:Uncharacterized protein n=1 Tax=Stutzerimonas stutzeri TaxID=316 RepID=A0A0D7E206_STUST|nr:hypothetical protein LO50_17070 [Stutzerimonas stutzeri]